jgi:hypothetical protein
LIAVGAIELERHLADPLPQSARLPHLIDGFNQNNGLRARRRDDWRVTDRSATRLKTSFEPTASQEKGQ